MKTLGGQLEIAVQKALKKAFPKASEEQLIPEVFQAQQKFGDYQCNNALKLGKALGKSPREVAEILQKSLSDQKWIEKIEIAGPGFLNIILSNDVLSENIHSLVNDSNLGVSKVSDHRKVIVEFSSPNIAKELHVGHLRSTIIGDSIARLFEFLGYDVLRLNHVGDWGTQFGMLIAYLKEHEPSFITEKEETDISELMRWYRNSKKLFDADAAFKKRAQKEVVHLQGGSKQSLEVWNKICDVSRKAFREVYDLLNVDLEERGESFYNSFLPEIVSDLEKKDLVTLSDGAKCVFMEGFTARDGSPLPMIIQKSDGGYNYDTTDMAAMRHRVEVEKAERIIIVTDSGQTLHFQMIEKASLKAGYLDPKKVIFNHVPFGVVLGTDGKKFKTRSGETVKLIDLLYEAINQAKSIFKERLPEAKNQEIEEMGKALGINAIKYADLSSHRVKDYIFSYDRMLRFEGNTAAFLLYSFVRIQGIKRKLSEEADLDIRVKLTHSSERALALKLCQFGETLNWMARDLLPNRLCEYLYELAETFNAFFRDCQVVGSSKQPSRIVLIEATQKVLEKGLELLGLKTLARM